MSILTLIAIGLIVAALAAHLILIALALRKTLFTLGTVNVGLRAIAKRVEPIEPILTEINSDLSVVRDALARILRSKEATIS
ncbi:MAG: hypothetical protein H0W21_13700 [Actinobacteria bacterium]|nr:hypothetical protein [Actinomycetota bacterium]